MHLQYTDFHVSLGWTYNLLDWRIHEQKNVMQYDGSASSCQDDSTSASLLPKKVREKSGERHNHKPQPFPDTKRKKKLTKQTSASYITASLVITFCRTGKLFWKIRHPRSRYNSPKLKIDWLIFIAIYIMTWHLINQHCKRNRKLEQKKLPTS